MYEFTYLLTYVVVDVVIVDVAGVVAAAAAAPVVPVVPAAVAAAAATTVAVDKTAVGFHYKILRLAALVFGIGSVADRRLVRLLPIEVGERRYYDLPVPQLDLDKKMELQT